MKKSALLDEKSLERLLEKFELAEGKGFEQAHNAMHDYLSSNSVMDNDLNTLYASYSRYSKSKTVNGKGKVLKELGILLLHYGNGSTYAKKTAEDLFFLLTNRSMQVKRYIALEALAAAPLYNGTRHNKQNLTTSFIDYLCNAVQSPKENAHFRKRSIETLVSLYPKLVSASRNLDKIRYRGEIRQSLSKIRDTMRYVKANAKSFGKKTAGYAESIGI